MSRDSSRRRFDIGGPALKGLYDRGNSGWLNGEYGQSFLLDVDCSLIVSGSGQCTRSCSATRGFGGFNLGNLFSRGTSQISATAQLYADYGFQGRQDHVETIGQHTRHQGLAMAAAAVVNRSLPVRPVSATVVARFQANTQEVRSTGPEVP